MNRKKVLRIVLKIIYWFSVGYCTRLQVLGNSNFVSRIWLIFSVLYIVLRIVAIINLQISIKEFYEAYKEGFEYLKMIQANRYKAYLNCNYEDIKKYSKELQKYGETLIETGEKHLEDKLLKRYMKEDIKEIVSKTQSLIETIRPE